MKKRIQLLYTFCISIISLNIYAQSPTFVSISTVDTECGASTGSITLTPLLSGSYSYSWNNGNTEASINNLSIGEYTCTVTKDGTTEVVKVSIYRPWDIERFEVGDTTLSIVGNSVTVNPNIPYTTTQLADQRTHCYDKTPIDIQNQTGSIFAKFAQTHPNFPNQIANPDTAAPPVFYVALFETKDLSNHVRLPVFVLNANLRVNTGGVLPPKIKFDTGVGDAKSATYTGFDYTDGDEFEIRFLGNNQVEAYLEGVLIGSGTLPQRTTNEYVAVIGFNDRINLDRRIAYDLKSSFCSTMPILKTVTNQNNKFGATGSIELSPVDLDYVNDTYSYQWSTGSTNNSISNLSKGNYSVTMTNTTGGTKVQTYEILDKLSFEKADPTNSILKIIDNHVTCDPALPMQSLHDYRTHAYDPSVVIDAAQGGGSVKFRVLSEHPVFPNQHSNYDVYNIYNSIFYLRLQEAVSPLPIPSYFLDYPFQMICGSDGRVFTEDRQLNGNTSTRSYIPNFHYHKGGYDIELRFIGNKVIEIYMNDILVGTRTINESADKYHVMIGFNDNPIFQRRIACDFRTNIESSALPVYSELKEVLDASYYPVKGTELYFTYKEEYRAGNLVFTIYDEFNQPINNSLYAIQNIDIASSSNAKRYGTNRYVLDIPSLSGALSGKFMILEIVNDKGEKQYLRFKK